MQKGIFETQPLIMKKSRNILFMSVLLAITIVNIGNHVCAQTEKPAIKKMLVLAKISENAYRYLMEDEMARAIAEKGVNAIASYPNISEEEAKDTSKLIEKAEKLEVDALIAFKIIDVDKEFRNTPVVSAQVGIPIRIGFLHTYIGTNVPLAGGRLKEQKVITVSVALYTNKSGNPSWTKIIKTKVKDDMEQSVRNIVKDTLKGLAKSKIL